MPAPDVISVSDFDHPMTTQTTNGAPNGAQDWAARFSDRMARVRASEIRELLKLLDQPDILSFAGGIPNPDLFPAARIAEAHADILAEAGGQALQYSASEGLTPLREWIAAKMTAMGAPCEAGNILVTSGSQQALDLIGRLF